MPHTVPKRPMKGPTEPVVARKGSIVSSAVSSFTEARRSARSTFSTSPSETPVCCALPSTLAFEYRSIGALAPFLLQKLQLDTDGPTADPVTAATPLQQAATDAKDPADDGAVAVAQFTRNFDLNWYTKQWLKQVLGKQSSMVSGAATNEQ